MKYSKMIKRAVFESGLKLNKISELVEKITGSRPDRAYLSRLQNGKSSPASDELNDALSSVLGIDPIDLKAAAYSEKIPPEVLERLKSLT